MNPIPEQPQAAYQQQFVRALLGDDAAEPAHWLAHPAFAVYRNTVMKGCIDALQANFPAVARLVGEDWFRSAAALYARANPPGDPRLLRYGTLQEGTTKTSFADFLAGFEPAKQLPYLPGVARLDGAWAICHAAADAAPANAAMLMALAPDQLGTLRLRPHPAAHWAWHEDAPVYTIWSASRQGLALDDTLAWQREGALLTRPLDSVQWCPIDRAACAFLDACAEGVVLAEAAVAALQADARCDLAGLLALLLQQGAFQQPTLQHAAS